jgi:hypothetical protein
MKSGSPYGISGRHERHSSSSKDNEATEANFSKLASFAQLKGRRSEATLRKTVHADPTTHAVCSASG